MASRNEQREAHEAAQIAARAAHLGLTEEELLAKEAHEAKMVDGEALFRKAKREKELIDYFLRHSGQAVE